ncbi:MAG: tRNA uridine-5-carboxymethylaminomethyl(34) synthesis GTPase MnmE, partial [Pseudomonadota bacterium]
MTAETIYALSSGSGRAGVAVIRISGPQTRTALERLIGKVPPARHAVHAGIRGVEQGDLIDRGLVLFFPAPASFTGEDVAELQVHGSPAVVARVLADLSQMSGCKLADPGAFTERAFLNGKLDLTEVEGLGDLLAAETERQRQDAVAQSTGLLRRRTEAWRADLVRALAL